ncbi:MAG: hypothetical protein DRN15_04520 [Thermoprotei archaeon]|nr:MAG: hypothetical protein DRM97_06310 [Thermoprotei archaeon]RLF23977.1 MAG: hypothetical protein DRN15_04520 [Thermoprotei archaeon]
MSETELELISLQGPDLSIVDRSVKRIFSLALAGFRATLGRDESLNWLFLRILIEANRAHNELLKAKVR